MEDQISCAICHEIYGKGEREPVMLPECGHTFCRCCLTSLPLVVCPICRKVHTGKPVGNLPINFAQLGIADYVSTTDESKGLGRCPLHGLLLDLWCTITQREICARCFFEDTKHSHKQIICLPEKIQGTIDAIEQRSLILSQVYLALRTSLATDKGEGCRNIYTEKLGEYLRGGRPSLTELERLSRLISPSDAGTPNAVAESNETVSGKRERGCVAVNSDGRKAKITWEDKSLHLYALCDRDVDAHITVKMSDVLLLIPQECPTVFMDVANTSAGKLGRIYIKVWSHLRRGQQFLALCQGHLGPTLRGSAFLDVLQMGGVDCLRGGRYLTENGPSSTALMDNLEWNNGHERPGRKGFVTGWSFQKVEEETVFGILLGDTECIFCCPFGMVVWGMPVVEKVTRSGQVGEATIVEVGTVIPNFIIGDHL